MEGKATMAQPNQPNQMNGQSAPAPKTVRIRMKPGCGRMLIGRKYKTADGLVDKRPRLQDDIIDVVDEYLEQGQIKEVPVEALASMLDAQGKPNRKIEGYPLQVVKGGEMTHDEHGNELPQKLVTENTWVPGRLHYNGQELVASHPDATFEIVQDNRAA